MVRLCDYNSDFHKPQSGVSFHYFNSNYNDIHTHNYWEVFLVTDGSLSHFINNTNAVLKKQDLYIIRPSDVHCFKQIENSQHINFMITDEKLKQLISNVFPELYDYLIKYPNHMCLHLDDYQYDNFLNIISQLYSTESHAANETVIKLFILDAFKLAYFQFYDPSKLSLVDNPQILFPAWLTELITKINSVKYISYPLEELCDSIPYSRVHVNRLFKQYMNTTIGDYFVKIKLKYACHLLETSNFTILYIASQIGYSSLSHFNRIFKKLYNCTPKEYRQKNSKTIKQLSTNKKN